MFDKTEQAEQADKEKQRLIIEIQQLENALKEAPDGEKKRIKGTVEESRKRLAALEQAPGKSSDGHPAEGHPAPAGTERPDR